MRGCRRWTPKTRVIDIAVDPSWQGIERRSENRVAEDSPARVKVLDPMVSLGPSFQARVVKASGEGLMVCAPRSILPGSVVQVRFRDWIVIGKVKYCLPVAGEFHIGVRLKEDW
jgi:hypothetical protein